MYKQLITYTFSDDDTREAFEEMVEDMGFEKQEDQSTYTLPVMSDVTAREMREKILDWAADTELRLDFDDRVDLYYIAIKQIDGAKTPVMEQMSFVYDFETELLVEE